MTNVFMHFPNSYQEPAEIVIEKLYQDKEEMLNRKTFPKDLDLDVLTLKVSFNGSSVTFFGTNDDFTKLYESIGNGLKINMIDKQEE